MQASKYKPNSPRNQIKQRILTKQSCQSMNFSMFRKKNSESVSDVTETSISFVNSKSPSMLTILGGIHLIHSKSKCPPDLFKEIELINADRSFVQFLNQKTMLDFLRVFKIHITSLQSLADILSFYPVSYFFLQTYSRQYALQYLQTVTQTENEMMMGNQFQIINDFDFNLRGNALDIVAKSLKLSVSIRYTKSDQQKFVRKYSLNQIQESYGISEGISSVQITSGSKNIVYNLELNKNYISEASKPKIELLTRKSRVKESKNGRASTQSRSLYRQKDCDRCGKKICQCKDIDFNDLNPNNLSKTISGGFGRYQSKPQKGQGGKINSIGMGFINVSKIINRDNHNKN